MRRQIPGWRRRAPATRTIQAKSATRVAQRTLRSLVAAAVTVGTLPLAQAQRPPAKKPSAIAKASTHAAKGTPLDGKKLFATNCAVCHQLSGEGVEVTYPPLAGSEWVTDDAAKMVRIILHGLIGPVDVAGQSYSGAMPPWGGTLNDAELAAVATYVRNAWGNKAAPVTAASVTRIRAETKSRTTPWTAPELARLKVSVRKD